MNLEDQEKKLKAVNKNNIFKHELKFKKISILFKKIEDDN